MVDQQCFWRFGLLKQLNQFIYSVHISDSELKPDFNKTAVCLLSLSSVVAKLLLWLSAKDIISTSKLR